MNERIKELADEAAKYSATMFLPTGKNGDELFVEKFAELIVRKCADIATNRYQRLMDGGKAIKEHFGVEEQTIKQDQVPLPTTREQAMAMLRVATFYLDTQK